MVPDEGIEPPTFGLQNRCTTAVLIRPLGRSWLAAAPRGRKAWARSAAGGNGRRPRALDRDRFVHARPRRHGDGDEGERARPPRRGTGRPSRAGSSRPRRGASGSTRSSATEPAPQGAAARDDVPDLLDRPVRHGMRDGACGKLEMREASALERGQQPDRRAVRRGRVGFGGEKLGREGRGRRASDAVGLEAPASAWRGGRAPAKRGHEHDLNRRRGA